MTFSKTLTTLVFTKDFSAVKGGILLRMLYFEQVIELCNYLLPRARSISMLQVQSSEPLCSESTGSPVPWKTKAGLKSSCTTQSTQALCGYGRDSSILYEGWTLCALDPGAWDEERNPILVRWRHSSLEKPGMLHVQENKWPVPQDFRRSNPSPPLTKHQ